MPKVILIFILISLVACAGGKSTRSSRDSVKIHKDMSSYYYFFMSQFYTNPEDLEKFGEYLELALEKDQESSFLWSQKAIVEAQHANWDSAIAHAKKSLELDPTNADSLVLIGKLHAANEQPAEAITYYRKALLTAKKKEEIYNILAREYATLKQKSNAYAVLRQCIRDKPDAVSCMYYLATLYLQEKNTTQAIKYYTAILEIEPDNPKILQTIAEIHLHSKKYKKATSLYEKLKELYPSEMSSYIRLGLIYYEAKETDKAIAEFETVIRRYPKSDRMNYFLGLLYLEKKDLDVSYDHLDKITFSSPFFKDASSKMIYIWRERGKIENAVEMLASKYPKKEKGEEYYGLVTSLLIYERNYKKAHSISEVGLRNFPNSEALLFQHAVLSEKLGNLKKAEEDLLKIIKMNPHSEKAYNYLGYTLLEKGEDLKLAEDYILRAHELKPDDGHITDSLAWLYYKQGNHQKALMLLNKANKQEPNEPTILEHLGDVYFDLKNKRRSRYYYEQSLRILKTRKIKTPQDEEQQTKLREKLGKF